MKKHFAPALIVLAVLLLAFFLYDRVFSQGMATGVVQMEENAAVGYADHLYMLRDARGIDGYKQKLIQDLNQTLYALSFAERDVKIHPPTARIFLSISSPKMRPAFRDIQKQRETYGWKSNDSEEEKNIQMILKRYAEFGNPYGI